MKYIIVIALLLLTQCDDDNQIACTEQFVYGLNITVKDSNTDVGARTIEKTIFITLDSSRMCNFIILSFQ